MTDTDLSDVRWDYSVGEPLTYEQMMAEKAMDADRTPRTGTLSPDEKNPYLFDDDPIDHHNFAVISIVQPHQHAGDGNIIKIRAVYDSASSAAADASNVDTERCDTFLFEMYKFCVVPMSTAIMSMDMDTRDSLMNSALEAYKRRRIQSGIEYMQRKQSMVDDIKRQEGLKEKLRAGEIDETDVDSASICPEAVVNERPLENPTGRSTKLKGDDVRSLYVFCVITMVDMADVDVDERLANTVFVKINGVFKTEESASQHAQKLRKMHRYKHMDIYVAHMFEWLQCPPDSALISNVVYEQSKLNEALGTRNFTAMESMQQMVEDNSIPPP